VTTRAQEFEDVFSFWFPDLGTADHARMVRQFEWWFRGGADSAINERFSLLLERAIRGELDHWSKSPRPRLALIIVLDQFSRSLYRDTARAFAQDQKALGLAVEGIEIGQFAALETPWEKTFFFLPLGHSEQLSHLERGVASAWTSRCNCPLRPPSSSQCDSRTGIYPGGTRLPG
jgi:uncharacterized protein (DUF924 family)